MRIDALFGGEPTISFEFFPPREDDGAAQLFRAIDRLRPLQPSFVSITRTGIGTAPTVDLTVRIQRELKITSMSHLTCVHHSRTQMGQHLDHLWDSGIRNVLALRGDPPQGQPIPTGEDSFSHASDLVAFVKAHNDFSIGVAGYPEGHPQCLNLIRDLEHLKAKIDLGAGYIITQLFFDNEDFYRWRDRAVAMGITVPIVAGIMPILNVAQIKRFVTMCGAKIPHPLLQTLEAAEGQPDTVQRLGIDHAIAQCRALIANQAAGVHFYTLNRSQATVQICRELRTKQSS